MLHFILLTSYFPISGIISVFLNILATRVGNRTSWIEYHQTFLHRHCLSALQRSPFFTQPLFIYTKSYNISKMVPLCVIFIERVKGKEALQYGTGDLTS